MTPGLLAIIPAAGKSRRMGQPKLLLDIAGQSVIARVLGTLKQAGVSRTLVVVRPGDEDLIREVRQAGGEVVIPPTDPEEMRQSVECALRYVRDAGPKSGAYAGWMLVPADHPTLDPLVVQELISAWSHGSQQIAVPVFDGRRGHPTIFAWDLVEEVLSLPADQGLNQLLRSKPDCVLEVCIPDSRILDDLDTPEDLQRLRLSFKKSSAD